MISPNPCDWVKAGVSTVKEYCDSMLNALRSSKPSECVVRLDTRFLANCMRYLKAIFHMIDVDDRNLAKEVETMIQEYLGYRPAMITTVRGVHYLINVSSFDKNTAKKWFNKDKGIIAKIEEINQTQCKNGEKIVEYKSKAFQEPVPGVHYREVIPRFYPEEK